MLVGMPLNGRASTTVSAEVLHTTYQLGLLSEYEDEREYWRLSITVD